MNETFAVNLPLIRPFAYKASLSSRPPASIFTGLLIIKTGQIIDQYPVSPYSRLKASMGESLAAFLAGYSPKNKPIAVENSTAITTILKATVGTKPR